MVTIQGKTFHSPQSGDLPGLCGRTVTLCGTVHKIRRMRGFAFVLLRMRRGVTQCVYQPGRAGFSLDLLREGACVSLTGEVASDQRSRTGCEVILTGCTVLSEPAEEPPVVINGRELTASLDTLIDYRPLTLRNEKQRAVFQLADGLCRGFRSFFQQNGFTEIHTPKLVGAGAEGGAGQFSLRYFSREAFLAQSPQLYKQIMVGVYERVFEIGPVYRAEKHDTSRHLNEFTGVDLEMGYIGGFQYLMQTETFMLREAFDLLSGGYGPELELLGAELPRIESVPVLRFTEALELLGASVDGEDLEPEQELRLCELIKARTGSEFVFVTHYPTRKRPFYAMEDPEDPKYTLSFDLLFRGLEITTGGQRIHRYEEQLEKLRRFGLNPESFRHYLMAHKYGLPPHGGFGLGLERLLMKLLGFSNIREAALFVRDTSRLEP